MARCLLRIMPLLILFPFSPGYAGEGEETSSWAEKSFLLDRLQTTLPHTDFNSVTLENFLGLIQQRAGIRDLLVTYDAHAASLGSTISYKADDKKAHTILKEVLSTRGLTYEYTDFALQIVKDKGLINEIQSFLEHPEAIPVKKALERKVSLNFTSVPLDDVLKYLRNELKISITLDPTSDSKISDDVTVFFRDISAGKALAYLFQPEGLTFVIEKGGIRVITSEQWKEMSEITFDVNGEVGSDVVRKSIIEKYNAAFRKTFTPPRLLISAKRGERWENVQQAIEVCKDLGLEIAEFSFAEKERAK